MKCAKGFTLVELMIVVALVAIIGAIAVPAYQGYIRESRLTTMRMNLDTLRIAVEAFRLDSPNSNYGPSSPDFQWSESGAKTIDAQYGWRPEGGDKAYVYTVDATSQATPIFSIWAVDSTKKLGVRCDKVVTTAPATAYRCCDKTDSTVTSACP